MKTFFRHIKTALAAFPIIAAVFLSGCGGGGGSATPPSTPTYSISGTVSGAVLQGVMVYLTGGGMTTGYQVPPTITDASGNYSFTGLASAGSYTITPAKVGFVFSSNSTAVSVNGANVTGTNFTATANTAATYSISGTVSGLNSSAVMITLSGGTTGTTFTNYNGNYSFTGLVNGSYTVTPSYAGNSYSTGFSPSVTTVTVNSANVPNTNFTVTYTLSGKVRIGNLNGAGLQGVTINLAGATPATTATDANGNYTISGLAAGSNYTVVPSLAGYSFSPASSVVDVYSNMPPPNTDFYATSAATTYSISGTVSGAISQYVKITLSGANIGAVLTDANGNYTFSGLVNGSYTVTPSLAGYSFGPSNSAVTINGANATAINFVAAVSYSISGTVSGIVQQGVTINLTGATNASTTTGAAGDYNFSGLSNGSYTVTPSIAGYTFNPANSAVTINGANLTANNFISSVAPVSYSISGTVSGAVLQGVTVNLTGASNASTTTDASGNYTISGLANGSYAVTPSLAGYAFSPTNRAVTISSASSTANNFVSATVPVTYTISGTASGAMYQGVTINLTGAVNASTATDASGNYSFAGLANGSYTVAPCLRTLSAASIAVTINGANSTANNFALASGPLTFSISGTISGIVQQGVTINLTVPGGGISVYKTTITGLANGNYSICGLLYGSSYTVTPSLAGYTFSPASTAVTINNPSNPTVNFVSTNIAFVPVNPLPQATVGTAYSNTVVASISGGTPPYHYQSDSLMSGAPPIGMTVGLNGILAGTPSVAGTYTFGVCAVDLVGTTSCPQVLMNVVAPGSSNYYWANWNCGISSQCASTMGAYTGSSGPLCTVNDCNSWKSIYFFGASCSTTATYTMRNATTTVYNRVCAQSGVDF